MNVEALFLQVLFWALSLGLCATAIAVTRSRNLVHAVFWLAATLLLTSAMMVVLHAPFLAGIQVLLYAGGVITLMLFGVMLTQRAPDTNIPVTIASPLQAAVAALFLFATIASAIWTTPELAAMTPTHEADAAAVGAVFLSDQVIAFEALSVLLLAAMIGAIVLARKRDP